MRNIPVHNFDVCTIFRWAWTPHYIGGVQVDVDDASVVNECDTSLQLCHEGFIQLRGSSPEPQGALDRDRSTQSSRLLNLVSSQTRGIQQHAAQLRRHRGGSNTESCDSSRNECYVCMYAVTWSDEEPESAIEPWSRYPFHKITVQRESSIWVIVERAWSDTLPRNAEATLLSKSSNKSNCLLKGTYVGKDPSSKMVAPKQLFTPLCSIPPQRRNLRWATLSLADQYRSLMRTRHFWAIAGSK